MDGSGMHQPINITIPVREYEALVSDNEILQHVVCELEDVLRDYEKRPETVYEDILEIKKEIFPLCKRMLYISAKFAKRLSRSENVRKLHDDLLDIYNEVKYDDTKHGSESRSKKVG